MKHIFDTKEFLALEPEDKHKVLELELEKFEGEDLASTIENLKNEEAELLNSLTESKEKMVEYTGTGIDFSGGGHLQMINQELEELKQKSGQIKQKSIELDKNKYALELKNSIAKKASLSQEIEELKLELEGLRAQKIESQNTLVEIRANYDSFYASYNEELSRLMFEEKKNHFSSSVAPTEDILNDRFKLEEILKTKNDEIIRIKEEIDRLNERCSAVEADIAEKQEQISNLSIPEESKELIVQAKDLESEIIIYDEMLKHLDKLIDSNKEELELAKVKYSSELQSEKKIEEDLKKISDSTAKVFENSELSNFQKLRNCDKSLADVRKVEIELTTIDKRINDIKSKISKRLDKVDSLKSDINNAEDAYNQKLDYCKLLKTDLTKLQETREEILGSNCLGMITEYTKIGDLCPICKTRITQKNHIEVIDLAGIEREIEMAKSKVNYAEKEANNAFSNVSAMRAISDYELALIENDKQEITNLQNSKINVYKQVIDINDKTEENFENLKTALTKTTSALENIINLEDKLQATIQENTSRKVEYGTKISMLTELEEQLIDLYYVLQKEKAERELLMLEAKFNVSADNFEEKRTTLAENELQITELTKELTSLYLQASELKNQIFANQENLCLLEHERGVLETKIESSKTSNDIIENGNENICDIDSLQDKMEELKESHKHLLSLKQDAENSMQNIIKDFEIKSKILAFKIDDYQDISALVSSLIYRYNFKDENEVKEYIVTDNMLKLKESEIKSYNSMLQKLELQREYLSEKSSLNTNNAFDEYAKLVKTCEEINLKLGAVREKLESKQELFNEYSQILILLEKYK